MRSTPSGPCILALAAAIGAVLVACGAGSESTLETSGDVTTVGEMDASAGGTTAPRGPSPTTFGAQLQAMGLDPRNMPALHDLDRNTKLRVMRTFNSAMGTTCEDCHAAGDYSQPTPRKEAATSAWEDIVRKMTVGDGGQPLYCDSCHYGTFHFLDRSDRPALKEWMRTNFVDKLHRKDGVATDCLACHATKPTYQE
jgi:hypothetical protein